MPGTYNNLSGVIGKFLILLPVALYTALAMAGATPTSAISPMPLAPVGLMILSGLFTNNTSIGGASALTDTW